MEREIIFRGKRVDNGEWVEGDLTRYSEHMSYITADLIEGKVFETLTETVGQYTGLKDCNEKMIFEGDILKDTLGWIYEVRFDNNNGRFLGYQSKPRGNVYICYVGREPRSIIIGNIHDNPELLEVQ